MVSSACLKFLQSVEGNKYDPYVPRHGKSGVTLGMGVDLGNLNAHALEIPGELKDKLALYYGLSREEARVRLRERPLCLSKEEIDLISMAAIDLHAKELEKWYNKASRINFNSLTENQKCVLLSVKYQYGNLPKRTPKFWTYATDNDWDSVYYELMNFGDAYPTRRHREAKLIAKDMA